MHFKTCYDENLNKIIVKKVNDLSQFFLELKNSLIIQ